MKKLGKERILKMGPHGMFKKTVTWSSTFIFLLLGLPLGVFMGGYGALVFLSFFHYRPDEPWLLERLIIMGGIILGLLYAFVLASGGRFVGKALADYLISLKNRGSGNLEIRSHKRISSERQKLIQHQIGFLFPYKKHISAIVLVGSTVYNLQSEGSDIDIVVIARNEGYDLIQEVIFQHQTEQSGHDSRIEYTILSKENAEREFRNGSPFASSIRFGLPLYSDGVLEKMKADFHSLIPTRSYILRSLFDGIITQYYSSLRTLNEKFRTHHAKCTIHGRCEGHGPSARLTKVILQMLYITLPLRGYLPLTKTDVACFAGKVYGKEVEDVVTMVIAKLRGDISTVTLEEYGALKALSTRLIVELLRHVGFTREIRQLIRDVRYMIRGEYSKIKSNLYRNCVTS
jgi:predicted nucleotidyltransferase